MYLIKRTLHPFGIDLEYDGRKVKVKGCDKIIDSVKVKGFKAAAEKMREIEEKMHQACQTMG